MVDVDDKKHLYEVKDPEGEYDGTSDEFPHRPIANIQINDKISGSKCPWIVVIGFLVVLVFINIILLGVNGVTLTHLNTLDVCANSASASPGGLTSDGGTTGEPSQSLPNCSVVYTTWADDLAQNNTALRGQVSRLESALNYKMDQLLNTTSNTAWKLNDLGTFADQQNAFNQNITDSFFELLQTTGDSAQKLTNIVGTLSNIKDTAISTSAIVDDILLVVEELLALQNGSTLFNSLRPISCADIKQVLPSSPTGYYHVNSRNIYCNMDELCGVGGGWTRIAYLNMSDAAEDCPSGFRRYQPAGIRSCGRLTTNAGCSSVSYPTNGINYTQICGRVIGYQKGTPDAVHPGFTQHNNLNAWYVDGVSITRGSPREHVWTLMNGFYSNTPAQANCPCNTNAYQANLVQSFVGSNYYCESGDTTPPYSTTQVYFNDPLWDGQQCLGLEVPCCTNKPNLPWFHRDYGNVTSSASLELRVCGDEGWQNEDTPVGLVEIYVQ